MGALPAQHLLPRVGYDIELVPGQRHGEHGGGCVANGQAGAVGGDPIAVGNLDARGGAVPGEDDVVVEVNARQVCNLAVTRFDLVHVGQLELLDDIGNPARTEGLPGQYIDAALPEQRPQRHLHRARVGGRHDRNPVALGQTQNTRRLGTRQAERLLAQRRAMRTAQRVELQRRDVVARTLAARAGGKIGILGFDRRLHRDLECKNKRNGRASSGCLADAEGRQSEHCNNRNAKKTHPPTAFAARRFRLRAAGNRLANKISPELCMIRP